MELVIDPDVKAVAEFMQERFRASRLRSIADGVAALGPLLWSEYEVESLRTLRLIAPAISACDPQKQPDAT
jgi:hypothetical protein